MAASSARGEAAASRASPGLATPRARLGPGSGTPLLEVSPNPIGGTGTSIGSPAQATPPVVPRNLRAESPLLLERSQRLWQPSLYLQDFVCDCLQNGRSMSRAGATAGSCRGQRGSCAPKGESDICEGGAVDGINPSAVQSPSQLQQPRCLAFSYAAVVKAGRTLHKTQHFTSKCSSTQPNTVFRGKSVRSSIPTNMEMGLLSVQSDSINLVELDLLETLTTVNGDESMLMTDDLLDPELESIAFSQSTPSPTVLRVHSERVGDSQTAQNRVSHELEYTDPHRSNPDSAFLDITRPATAGTSMSPELIWDDNLVPEQPYALLPQPQEETLPIPLHERWRWVDPVTDLQIRAT